MAKRKPQPQTAPAKDDLSALLKKAKEERAAKARTIYETAKKELADLGYIIGFVGKTNFATGQMDFDVILIPTNREPQ